MAKIGSAAQSAFREIRAHAGAGRVLTVEPYTLFRWASATKLPEIVALSNKNRRARVQPYTFERWALEIARPRRARRNS